MPASDIIRVRRFFERGVYFLGQGSYPEACTNFKDALQINPNFLPARTHMALALAQQHKYVDAIKLLEENIGSMLSDIGPSNIYIFFICLLRQGKQKQK